LIGSEQLIITVSLQLPEGVSELEFGIPDLTGWLRDINAPSLVCGASPERSRFDWTRV